MFAKEFFQILKTYNIPMVLEEALLKQREILLSKLLFEPEQVSINPWLVLERNKFLFNPPQKSHVPPPESCRQTRES